MRRISGPEADHTLVLLTARRRVATGTVDRIELTDLMICDPHTKSVFANHHVKDHRYTNKFELESAEWCVKRTSVVNCEPLIGGGRLANCW